jgi:thiamine-phosphate pyrophosphorylase
LELPRLYPILDTGTVALRGYDTISAAESLVAAGVGILQFRHKAKFDRSAFAIAEAVASLCRRRGVLFIIDDRADIAMLLKAGLHLGQEDLPPANARKLIGEHAIIGYSTHNEDQLLSGDREPVTYLAIGPVFNTTSKQRPDPYLGTGPLSSLKRLTAKPLVAIGGITRDNAREVFAAGADSVAVIGDLYPEDRRSSSIARRAEEWLKLVNEN